MVKKGLIKEKRKSLDTMANSIKVYRLWKEGEKWEDIAKEIFPKDFQDPPIYPNITYTHPNW